MAPTANMTPEQRARLVIDRQLEQSGWVVQDPDEMNILAFALEPSAGEFQITCAAGQRRNGKLTVY